MGAGPPQQADDGEDRGGAGAGGGEGEAPLRMPELPGFYWDAAQGKYFRAPGRGSRGARSRAEQHAAFRQQLQLQQLEARPAPAKGKGKGKAKGKAGGRRLRRGTILLSTHRCSPPGARSQGPQSHTSR